MRARKMRALGMDAVSRWQREKARREAFAKHLAEIKAEVWRKAGNGNGWPSTSYTVSLGHAMMDQVERYLLADEAKRVKAFCSSLRFPGV